MNEIETFYGLLEGTADALRVLELCRQGRLGRVRRRLHEKERKLIRSGSVFVFDEQESGIRRWTDGRLWSPSRILGNFLIYRELERRPTTTTNSMMLGPVQTLGEVPTSSYSSSDAPPPPYTSTCTSTCASVSSQFYVDEQQSSSNAAINSIFGWPPMEAPVCPSSDEGSPESPASSNSKRGPVPMGNEAVVNPAKLFRYDPLEQHPNLYLDEAASASGAKERCAASLLGPNAFRLLKSKKLMNAQDAATGTQTRYIFKPYGLIKKTISAKVDGRMQHLICYYSEADFLLAHHTANNSLNNAHADCIPPPHPLALTLTDTLNPIGRLNTLASSKALMEELRKTRIPPDLILHQNFRRPPIADSTTGPTRRRNSINVLSEMTGEQIQSAAATNAPPRRRNHTVSLINSSDSLHLIKPGPELLALDLANGWNTSIVDEHAAPANHEAPEEFISAEQFTQMLMEANVATGSAEIATTSMEPNQNHQKSFEGVIMGSKDPVMPVVDVDVDLE